MKESKLSQNRGMDTKKQAHIVNHVKDIPTLLNEAHLRINSITGGCIRY